MLGMHLTTLQLKILVSYDVSIDTEFKCFNFYI